jgi:hypothetical protein
MRFQDELRKIRTEAEKAAEDKRVVDARNRSAATDVLIGQAKQKIREHAAAGNFDVRLLTITEFDAENIDIPDDVEYNQMGTQHLRGPAAALRDFLEREQLYPRLHARGVGTRCNDRHVVFDLTCNAWV